jgi:Protein of unknown function (DUF5818)
MRQMFLLVSVLLLGLSWAVAQDATQGSSSPQSGSSAGSGSGQMSGQTGSAAGQKTVTGCLSGSNGSFTLTDKHGKSYQLTGDTAKLTEHVGHEVKVTGSASSSGSAGSSSAASGTTGSAGAGQSLEVTSVKHVSKSCQAGAGGAMTH